MIARGFLGFVGVPALDRTHNAPVLGVGTAGVRAPEGRSVTQGSVQAGEAAGILDIVLDRVALQIEKEQMIKRRVKGAMVGEKDMRANFYKVVCERNTVYLMGLVTRDEGAAGANVAAQVPGVEQVVKVFQYIKPEDAQALSADIGLQRALGGGYEGTEETP